MFAYPYRWGALAQPPLPSDVGEARDRQLEQYLYAPPQQYVATPVYTTGATATIVNAGVISWERQRGQFVVMRGEFTVNAAGVVGDEIAIPPPTAATPDSIVTTAGTVPFLPSGYVAVWRLGTNVYIGYPAFQAVPLLPWGIVARQTTNGLTGAVVQAGDTISLAVCYRERL